MTREGPSMKSVVQALVLVRFVKGVRRLRLHGCLVEASDEPNLKILSPSSAMVLFVNMQPPGDGHNDVCRRWIRAILVLKISFCPLEA